MKRIAIVCVMQLMVLAVMAQQNMAELFKVMPDSVMPMLTKNNRLDMIDFLEAKMKAEVTNLLDGDSEMTYMSADSLSIRMSSALRVDLFFVDAVQPYDSCQQVICMRYTYLLATTSEEEQVDNYYSVRWHRLPSPELVSPMVSVSTILKQDDEVFSKQ